MPDIEKATPPTPRRSGRTLGGSNLPARGEPYLWAMGGALVLGILMVAGFLALILYNGLATFHPKPLHLLTLADGSRMAGEFWKSETYRPAAEDVAQLAAQLRREIEANHGLAARTSYRTGNYDLYNVDFRWVSDFQVIRDETPPGLVFVERLEWGPFVGRVKEVAAGGERFAVESFPAPRLEEEIARAGERRDEIRRIERDEIGGINHRLNEARLALRRAELAHGPSGPGLAQAREEHDRRVAELHTRYGQLEAKAREVKERDAAYTLTLADVNGREKALRLSEVVRLIPTNDLGVWGKLGVYLSRWWEFLSEEPREANTEGGVLPAIFGTFCMTVLMALAVAPFGIMAALYLREYAKQGRLVSVVRICVNNLAGVPSIVYGVFGLGFFAYIVGASIDQAFFPERLPNPTFGTGGLLWSALTLALLTVPVVIVSTEEALAAVPQSMREGSLACGASKWQTIKHIVLPRAMPGIMTGLILAMARGAGEVAPLMLVGVVKLAPELPIDGFFPYIHLERSFMHLGFHIYDVGFQSRNSEAGKPMVFVTTMLLICLVFLMNWTAIAIRNRLKRKYLVGHF